MKQDFSDQIGSNMDQIIGSEEHKQLFSAPVSLKKEAQDINGLKLQQDPTLKGPASGGPAAPALQMNTDKAKAYDPFARYNRNDPVAGQHPTRAPGQPAERTPTMANKVAPDPMYAGTGTAKEVQQQEYNEAIEMNKQYAMSRITELAQKATQSPEAAGQAGAVAQALKAKPGSQVTMQEAALLGLNKQQLEAAGFKVVANVKDMVNAIVAIANDLSMLGFTTSEMVADKLIESIAMETSKVLQKKAE